MSKPFLEYFLVAMMWFGPRDQNTKKSLLK